MFFIRLQSFFIQFQIKKTQRSVSDIQSRMFFNRFQCFFTHFQIKRIQKSTSNIQNRKFFIRFQCFFIHFQIKRIQRFSPSVQSRIIFIKNTISEANFHHNEQTPASKHFIKKVRFGTFFVSLCRN